MDHFTARLENVTAEVNRYGLDSVPEAASLGLAMIDHAPVLAEILISTGDPMVARERAFGRIVGAAQALTGAERTRLESVLSFWDTSVLEIPAATQVAV